MSWNSSFQMDVPNVSFLGETFALVILAAASGFALVQGRIGFRSRG
jgi:hypothetical protein